MEGAATGLSAILGDFTTFLTWTTTSMTSLVSWIVDTPLVMAVIAMFFIGFILSMFVRAFHSVQDLRSEYPPH